MISFGNCFWVFSYDTYTLIGIACNHHRVAWSSYPVLAFVRYFFLVSFFYLFPFSVVRLFTLAPLCYNVELLLLLRGPAKMNIQYLLGSKKWEAEGKEKKRKNRKMKDITKIWLAYFLACFLRASPWRGYI